MAPPTELDDPKGEAIGERSQELSSLGQERIIPVRIVQLANSCAAPDPIAGCPGAPPQGSCSPCTGEVAPGTCGPDTADYDEIRLAFEKANWALRSVGVQVYVRSIEKYKMPLFTEILHRNDATLIYWANADLRTQLKRAYPSLLDSTFDIDPLNGDKFKERNWLHAAQLRKGDPREIVIWVAECSHGGDGRRPWEGGASFTADREFFKYPRHLAHEFGHLLGLEHTMNPHESRNPEKVADIVWDDKSDYWDLVYGRPQGGGSQFFTTRAAAEQYVDAGGALYAKHLFEDPHPPGIRNCTTTSPNCTLSCFLEPGPIWRETGDPELAGLAFTFPGDNPGSGIYRRGFNAMMYIDNDSQDLWPTCPWTTFSESQAEQVRRTLRSDIRVNDEDIGGEYDNRYTAKRNLLGDYRAISGFDKLDFNNDGARDFAVWQPPGTPTLISPAGFHVFIPAASPPPIQFWKAFGFRGDVPVPADYDGDGRTDLAVVRSGGSIPGSPYVTTLQWTWCKSVGRPVNDPDCATPGLESFGNRGDIALPGLDFDGNAATRELAVYRRGTGLYDYVDWKIVGQPGSGGSIQVPAYLGPVVQMHGLYDSDAKTDIVIYKPIGATFEILRSGTVPAWDINQRVTRSFNTALTANAWEASDAGSSAPAVRHGGVALAAENLVGGVTRRVLRVWDPYTGNWYTMWNPLTSSTVDTCAAFGTRRDVPLAGPIDRNQDGKTDMVYYRPTNTGPVIHLRETCGSTTYSIPVSGGTARSTVSALRDLNLDGRGEFVVIDSETSTWRRFFSSGNTWYEGASIVLGELGGMAL